MTELSKTYNPKEVEEKWLNIWLKEKLFKSTINKDKESFSIVLPPPNVTGNLHMGHAFGDTIQDVLIRYNRMNGKNVLWQGGTDHAGIATQVLVERDLSKKEKKRKEDIGREEFLKRVWAWKEKNGNEIIEQMKKLGCAMDYDRLVFTMDENYTKAIKKVFVELYQKGLIYRGKRIVNWCPKCATSLSDLELETENIKGKLYYILYPFNIKDVSKGGIVVATTRPETMFGDVAVAVNPDDVRFKKLVGMNVTLPLVNKQIPVISDDIIKMDFGTGAVKTTPAHDANDNEIFTRHKELKDSPIIMDLKAKIQDKDNLGIPVDIIGLDRFKARKITLQKLEEAGLLKKIEEYDQVEDKHDRCGNIIEPYLSDQWYVKMQPLAKLAIKAIESEVPEPCFLPKRYEKGYLDWLKNIKDWCISRQLWWGHQIPVWYKKGTNEICVSEEPPKDIENYIQDPDVLDTWFSSALWPFVTLGWTGCVIASEAKQSYSSNDESYFKTFYPTSVLATARDIINLWVSRMIFMGLEFTSNVPFKEILIHPVIQTPDGKRMSKSKGNAIDPLEMIDKYGADANRFWYFSLGVIGNQDVRFPGRKGKDGKWESDILEQYRRFANKLWNAVRFVLQNVETLPVTSPHKPSPKTIADKWILHKYTQLLIDIEKYFELYDFSKIAESIYKFTWDDFCDWYIEISKKQLSAPKLKESTQQILLYIIEGLTKILHPIMPFITEEIWNSLVVARSFLLLSSYPTHDARFLNEEANKSFTHVIETTRTIRNLRQVLGISWANEIESRLFTTNDFEKSALENSVEYISGLTKSKVIIGSNYKPVKPSTGALLANTRVIIPLSGLVDLDNMLNALNKKKDQYLKDKESNELKLKNTSFVTNAPQDKIDEVHQRIREFENQIRTIDEQIELLK